MEAHPGIRGPVYQNRRKARCSTYGAEAASQPGAQTPSVSRSRIWNAHAEAIGHWVYISAPGPCLLASLTPTVPCLVPLVQHYIPIVQSIVGLQKVTAQEHHSDDGTKWTQALPQLCSIKIETEVRNELGQTFESHWQAQFQLCMVKDIWNFTLLMHIAVQQQHDGFVILKTN